MILKTYAKYLGDQETFYLTYGKLYEVIEEDEYGLYILDDLNTGEWIDKEYFSIPLTVYINE